MNLAAELLELRPKGREREVGRLNEISILVKGYNDASVTRQDPAGITPSRNALLK